MTAEGVIVVVPCGGRGSRLRPLTDVTPKPLLPVFGRPVISYLLDALFDQGFERILLSVGYGAAEVSEFAQRLSRRRVSVVQSPITGGCGIMADPTIRWGKGPILVAYSDVLVVPDLAALLSHHSASGAELTLTAHPATLKTQACTRLPADLDPHGAVVREVEGGPFWTYAPFAVLELSVIKALVAANLKSVDLVGDVVRLVPARHTNYFRLDAPVVDIGEAAFAAGLLCAQSSGESG